MRRLNWFGTVLGIRVIGFMMLSVAQAQGPFRVRPFLCCVDLHQYLLPVAARGSERVGLRTRGEPIGAHAFRKSSVPHQQTSGRSSPEPGPLP